MGRRKIKKILFLTGSRGEWGYIKPLLTLIKKNNDFEYALCVTNMHLLPYYGDTYKEILNDGFKIDFKINMSIDGYNHFTHIKSLSIFLSSFSDILESYNPDCIILSGDRGEQLMGSIAGSYTYIPTIHIQAGEKSGNIDGMARHAIGKFSHLHIASSTDAEKRLIKLGEEKFRIKKYGAPQLDDMIIHNKYLEDFKLTKNLKDKSYFLLVQHPVTEQSEMAYEQMKNTILALNNFEEEKVIIMPNNDTGTTLINKAIHEYTDSNYKIFKNVNREIYLTLLKYCKAIIGNSSSGLLEAPTYQKACVNIGRRQAGRDKGINVIDVNDFNKIDIEKAIKKSITVKFQEILNKSCTNPYGDGKTSEKIYDLLKNIEINDTILTKSITY